MRVVSQGRHRGLAHLRADHDLYYYGTDTPFERHPVVIRRVGFAAPGWLPALIDGLIWRSRTTKKGMRRVNYYVKHLLVDAHGGFSKTIEWVTEIRDPSSCAISYSVSPTTTSVGNGMYDVVCNDAYDGVYDDAHDGVYDDVLGDVLLAGAVPMGNISWGSGMGERAPVLPWPCA